MKRIKKTIKGQAAKEQLVASLLDPTFDLSRTNSVNKQNHQIEPGELP
ncbi:hypothetical protein LCGC14_2392210, partial [marine sediment metagenome]